MASRTSPGGEKNLLLAALDQAFNKRSWHGPNLRASVKRLTAEEAGWRPDPARKSIAEIVVHCAYWKYTVRRRLRGEKRGSFALPGSNWFALPEPLSVETWNNCLALLDGEHAALHAAVAEVPADRLHRGAPTSTPAFLIQGAAAHDLYHAGQINLLKRMLADATKAPARRGSKPKHDR